MKKLLLFIAAAISMQVASVELTGQDLEHYKRIVKELSSAKYQGRGYAEDGANKAGRWIAKEFAKAGADEVICQPFKLDINTFPGKMEMSIDGRKQIPGVDFTVREFNPSIKGEFKLSQIKFLFNLDMIADNNPAQYCEVSDEGMKAFPTFEKTNEEKGYFKSLNRVELAGNSDHYPFAQRNVPCIFLMNEDGEAFKYYHTIHDNWKNSIFTNYEPIFNLIKDFIDTGIDI